MLLSQEIGTYGEVLQKKNIYLEDKVKNLKRDVSTIWLNDLQHKILERKNYNYTFFIIVS